MSTEGWEIRYDRYSNQWQRRPGDDCEGWFMWVPAFADRGFDGIPLEGRVKFYGAPEWP